MKKTYEYFKILTLMGLSFLCLYLTGCGILEETMSSSVYVENDETIEQEQDRREEESVSELTDFFSISQNALIETPKVLIDPSGYDCFERKTILIYGEEIESVFRVINKDTRKCIYTGEVTYEINNSASKIGQGDFSSIVEPGKYYIETDYSGVSYTFSIKENRYIGDLTEISKHFDKVYKQDNFEQILRYDDLLLLSLMQSGTVMLDYKNQMITMINRHLESFQKEKLEEEITLREATLYTTVNAKLYAILKEIDAVKAKNYLYEANKQYTKVVKMSLDETNGDAELFYCAAQLYQVTGYLKYHTVIKTGKVACLDLSEEQLLTTKQAYLYGMYTYISTTYTVDVPICTEFLEKFKEVAVHSADLAKDQEYGIPIFSKQKFSNRIFCIAVTERAIISREYLQILKDAIHYLSGRNETGSNYLEDAWFNNIEEMDKDVLSKDMGMYVFVIREIIESEANE